jgi:hypothetical protein
LPWALFDIVVSPFLIDALRVSPETKKARPIKMTDWAGYGLWRFQDRLPHAFMW